jgi:hypothetical protein
MIQMNIYFASKFEKKVSSSKILNPTDGRCMFYKNTKIQAQDYQQTEKE